MILHAHMMPNRSPGPCTWFAALLSIVVASLPASAAPAAPVRIDLPIQSFTLNNGLRVYVLEDHSTPSFAMRTVFDVGARDEQPGHTGFAHLFEHMMFKGSEKVGDGGHSDQVDGVGGYSNASTSWDHTDYWNELPSHYLDLILWLEADRLRALAVTERNFVNQRDAVKEEIARYYNRPYAAVMQEFMVEAFRSTPYGHSVFGSIEDLERSGVNEAQAFYREYYTPNNAVMVLAGDVDFQEVQKKVRKYYGTIPRGPERPPPVRVSSERRTAFERQVTDPLAPLPMLIMGWQTVAAHHPDRYALDLLASILLSGDSSRVTQRLQDEQRIVLDVGGHVLAMRDIGLMYLMLTPNEGVEFDAAKKAVQREIQLIQQDGVRPEELEKALNQTLVSTVEDLATNSGRVTAIGDGALHYDDPKRALTDLERYQRVSLKDIQRVARTYFSDQRMVMKIEPGGTPSSAVAEVNGRARSQTNESGPSGRDYPRPPAPSKPRPVNFPEIQSIGLDNGLQVYVIADHDVPLVTASLVFNAGTIYAEHLPEFTANMLPEGTTSRSKAELAEAIEGLGGTLDADVGLHSAAVATQVLTKDLEFALGLLADVVRNPAFPASALEKLQQQAKASIKAEKADAGSLASTLFGLAAYPKGHPYGRPFPREADIERITVADLREYHARMYQPANAYLVLAGDITLQQAQGLVTRTFDPWRAKTDQRPLPDPLLKHTDYEQPAALTIHLVDRPASAQTKVVVGNVAIPHKHEDWIALQLATSILGANSTGRLFKDLREVRGLAYAIGARVEPRRAPGAFKIGTGTRPENVGTMLEGIFEHLQRMRNTGPEPEECIAKIQQTVGRFPLQIQTANQIAYRINMIKSYELPWDYYRTYRDQVRRTTPDAIRDAAKSYMRQDPIVVVVGPADSVAPQIREVLPEARMVRYDTDLNVQDPVRQASTERVDDEV